MVIPSDETREQELKDTIADAQEDLDFAHAEGTVDVADLEKKVADAKSALRAAQKPDADPNATVQSL